MITSSSSDQVARIACDFEIVQSLESGSLMSSCEPPPLSTNLSLVAFDLLFFKSQLKKFCDRISDPIPLVSSNPLENLEQLLSPSKLSNSPSFRINHVPTDEEVSLLKSYLKALNHLGLPTLLEHGCKQELNKRMKWLEEEMQRVRDEIQETSIDFHVLEDEALRGQSILPQLIPSLRGVQKKKAAQASLSDNNICSLHKVLSNICDSNSKLLGWILGL
ncbi:hypothetical protein RHGRI_016835 [Rhododendron griersonianum]|uniref:Uncharacterized protein n=1 Tax=Rhododendron griersonianum TaxID=479676 RepID=A0AAV6JVP2_9ERIC|nr:hypothetical protein RHGRI_016835 [Rhododendron griersonianum]